MERDAVLFANEAFYRAFADRDFAAMDRLWARQGPVACIHPGWAPLVGRSKVMASWRGILSNPQSPAISCQQAEVFMQGSNAFVVCYEEFDGNYLIATNLFLREADGWKLVHHQSGPVPVPDDIEESSEAPMH
jgi:ketosteroid isomerase-like protein